VDVFGNESIYEVEAQPGKFQFDSVRAQVFNQPCFQKIWQANAVEPDEGAQHRQHQQKHADATPAETYAAFAPETGSHIMEYSPEW
jgi:hypothetical protein